MTNAREFNRIASDIFAPAYPVIAEQIIGETGITQGFCLDIGCGCGHLGLALAHRIECMIGLLEPSPEMRAIAAQNVADADLGDRMRIISGSAEAIPLEDNTVDLAVSRGSLFFWKNRIRAFKEIYRVLKPSGAAYIGGGFGNAAIYKEVSEKMTVLNKGSEKWQNKVGKRIGSEAVSKFDLILKAADILNYSITSDQDKGFWIQVRKNKKNQSRNCITVGN